MISNKLYNIRDFRGELKMKHYDFRMKMIDETSKDASNYVLYILGSMIIEMKLYPEQYVV